MDVHSSGKYLAADAQGLKMISIPDGRLITSFPGILSERDSISFSPDTKFLAAVGIHQKGGMEITNVATGHSQVLKQSIGKPRFVVRYGPDGTLFSGDNQGNIYHWNLANQLTDVIKLGTGIVSGLAIHGSGDYLMASVLSAHRWEEVRRATSDLVLYNVRTKKKIRIDTHGNRVFSVAFDRSGALMITGDLDGIVRVGRKEDKIPHSLIGHRSAVGDVVVSPDGRWIASTGLLESEVRLWPMPQGTPLNALPYPEFLSRLRGMTNVRFVANNKSATGFDLEYAPFPGWATRTEQ